MTIQLNNWVTNDFGIVLVFGDEKRADFGDKSDACVDKIDGLNAEFWLLFIILILIRWGKNICNFWNAQKAEHTLSYLKKGEIARFEAKIVIVVMSQIFISKYLYWLIQQIHYH